MSFDHKAFQKAVRDGDLKYVMKHIRNKPYGHLPMEVVLGLVNDVTETKINKLRIELYGKGEP